MKSSSAIHPNETEISEVPNLNILAVLRNKADAEWIKDLASDYDLCIVFPSKDGSFMDKGSLYMTKLRQHGFEIFSYRALNDNNSIFVLIRAPLEKLRAFADINNFSMPLDSNMVKTLLEAGNPDKKIAPVFLEHQPLITSLQPFDNLYGEYSRLVDENLFFREEGRLDPFSRLLRLKLSVMILHSFPPGIHLLYLEKSVFISICRWW